MTEVSPAAVVLGGINGSGKTTSSRRLLADRRGVKIFVNADEIARGLNAFAPESAAFEAGRVMLQRLNQLAGEKASFSFESTLAGKGYVKFLRELKPAGYRVEIYYFWLESVEYSISRVAARVRQGGHHFPEETIRQRYSRSTENFWKLYRPLADSWYIFDNSWSAPVLIGMGDGGSDPSVIDVDGWPLFEEQIRNAS